MAESGTEVQVRTEEIADIMDKAGAPETARWTRERGLLTEQKASAIPKEPGLTTAQEELATLAGQYAGPATEGELRKKFERENEEKK